MNKQFTPLVLIIGVACLGVGVYFLLQKSGNSISFESSTQTYSSQASTEPFRPKKTVPKGQLQGDPATGMYYRNYSNSLEVGVAYKFHHNETVYIYDGKKLRGVATGKAYNDFYGCPRNIHVGDCAPIYLMPSFVNKDMLDGEIMK